MSDLNLAVVSGRIGNIEINQGETRLQMRVASARYAGSERGEVTEWFTVIVFGKRAKALFGMLVVGQQVTVQAEMRNSTYENRDGQKVNVLELIAEDVVMGARPLEGGRPQ